MSYEDGQLFKTLFDQANTPICVLKANPPEFTIVAFNQQFKRSSQTSVERAVGEPVFNIYRPHDKASEEQYEILKGGLYEAIDTRTKIDLPILYFESTDNDNQVQRSWWRIEITPILNGSGSVTYLLCTTLNITDRELMRLSMEEARQHEKELYEQLQSANEELNAANEELTTTVEELHESQDELRRLNDELEQRVIARTQRLAESEKRLQSILDSLPQIAWTNTKEGEIDFYNKRWYDYTGLSFDETKGWGWKKTVHPDDLQNNLDCYTDILESNQPGEFEMRQKGRDGVYRWHLIRLHPLNGETDVSKHWIGTAIEIDALKKLQEQKDDFISIASHELKTPITTLKASLQLLDRMKDNPASIKSRHLIEQANRSMHKVSTLVDELLNVNRINQTHLPLHKTVFTLSELVNGCCNHISLAGKHNVVILGNKELKINADERAIDQVIVNLVNNAVKYAPGSEDIFIIIEQEDHMAKISVKDSGPGIPRDKLPYLFDRYFQAETTGYRKPGLGLGLYICSEIIKRHGGHIGVESELGKGSTFWFTLPLWD
jgi:PAS domain S-box-containing protein